MRRRFNEDEDFLIRKMYPDTKSELIAFILQRPIYAIYHRAHRLGLLKDEQWHLEMNRRLGTQLAQSEISIANRIQKGTAPVNKGKKQIEFMTAEGIERTKATRFKKGQRVHNEKEDGAIQIRHSHKERGGPPYKWIRLKKGKWEMLHVHNWKKMHGRIPKGKIIVFKNKDTMNCDVSNLEMITRRENMARNTIQRYPEEIKSTIRLLGKVNRKIKQHGKEQN